MADSYVQLPADSSGKKVDAEELTRHDGVVVLRQRFADGLVLDLTGDLAELILLEFKVVNFLLARMHGILVAGSQPIDVGELRGEMAREIDSERS